MASENNIGCLAGPLDLRMEEVWPRSDDPFRSESLLNDRRPMQRRPYIFNSLTRYSAPLLEHVGLSTCLVCPFVSYPWRPVFRAHIICYPVGLSYKHEAKRKHVSPRLLAKGNPSAYINLGFCMTKDTTPSLQKDSHNDVVARVSTPDLPYPEPPLSTLESRARLPG
jgi:hypothetical protein